jgi:hypothetical protein
VLAKVLFLILCIGASACSLLSMRQQRLDVVNDMAVIHRRMVQHDRALFEIRTRIAQGLTLDRIATLASSMGTLKPIGVDQPVPGEIGNPIRIASGSPSAARRRAEQASAGSPRPAGGSVASQNPPRSGGR